jgi:NADH-quinone oxidoreductase subunit C
MSEPSEPPGVGARLAGLLGADCVAGVSGGGDWARDTVDVPPQRWVAALTAARDELGCDFFDWLSAVDEQPDGFRVVAHVWSVTGRYGLLVRTLLGPDVSAVDSAVGVYPGAAWHERETYEMFGIGFAGHEDLRPLLLPDGFEGHPLRKDFVLASRVAKAWPGEKEPGEGHGGPAAGKRAPMRPPGVPAPGEWGDA